MNKKIDAIIVDDEKSGRELLRVLLADYCPEVRVIGTAGCADRAFELINELEPALVFLDVEMPGGNGFDLLKRFEKINFSVVFVTAYDQYALNAFKFSALDYILKPVDEDDLIKAVQKAVKNLSKGNLPGNTDSNSENLKNAYAVKNKLAVSTSQGLKFIEISNITKCKADGKYTWVFLSDGTKLLSTKNLGEFEGFLSVHNFIRVHHSSLVNPNYVKAYQNGRSGIIIMQDGSELEVSQRKKEDFIKRLQKI